MEKRLSEAVLTRFQVANPDDSDVALKKAGVAHCAARACFIKGHSAPLATPAGRPAPKLKGRANPDRRAPGRGLMRA
jgi:hypothetical protein